MPSRVLIRRDQLRCAISRNDFSSATEQTVVDTLQQPHTPVGAKDIKAVTGRRWIKDVQAGEKVIGYVTGTTDFAAFVDIGVVRHGSQGRTLPVPGFLHTSEVRRPYALDSMVRAPRCDVVVRKGMHLTAYIKDVFVNAGRITLSLDPSINEQKVRELRHSRRELTRRKRRKRLAQAGRTVGKGQLVVGHITQVDESSIKVDIKRAQLTTLTASEVSAALGLKEKIDLRNYAKPGDRITVRVESATSVAEKYKGKPPGHPYIKDRARLAFVGWGEIDVQDAESSTNESSTCESTDGESSAVSAESTGAEEDVDAKEQVNLESQSEKSR